MGSDQNTRQWVQYTLKAAYVFLYLFNICQKLILYYQIYDYK